MATIREVTSKSGKRAYHVQVRLKGYREATNTIWLDVFRRSGIGDADSDLLLNLSLNMVRGMAVNSLWQKDMKRYRELLDSWESLAYRAFPKLKHSA